MQDAQEHSHLFVLTVLRVEWSEVSGLISFFVGLLNVLVSKFDAFLFFFFEHVLKLHVKLVRHRYMQIFSIYPLEIINELNELIAFCCIILVLTWRWSVQRVEDDKVVGKLGIYL